MRIIDVKTSVYEKNDEVSASTNKYLHEKGIKTYNFLGSPGSGKTTILERLLDLMPDKNQAAVIEGDLYTDRDAERINKLGVQTIQLNTRGACHLEANMIRDSLKELNLEKKKYLIIDNIGNLVCTSEFKIGEDIRIGVLSVTEGNDKPMKYPLMFQTANLIILNKIDILPFTDFSVEQFQKDLKKLNPKAPIFQTCATKGTGLDILYQALFS